MRWMGRRESGNVRDLRGQRMPLGFGGGRFSLFSLPIGNRARLLLIIGVVVVALATGADPLRWLVGDFGPTAPQLSSYGPANDDARRFVAVVLADTEDVWTQVFRQRGEVYRMPELVLFTGAVQSACGVAGSAVGPFYCPRDSRVYLDLDFLNAMQNRLGAAGDFAQAYVIAHEVGHHVQNLLGRLNSAGMDRGRDGQGVRTELQADCYAGIWAHHTERMQRSLEPGDIDEAMNAAGAIGDDRLQKRSQGFAVPDSFTHGSSAQRQKWFQTGYVSGRLESCDTFSPRGL
ncbi:MAG: neutral zinc metallopeptidase [Bdellovibrionales bacterium]